MYMKYTPRGNLRREHQVFPPGVTYDVNTKIAGSSFVCTKAAAARPLARNSPAPRPTRPPGACSTAYCAKASGSTSVYAKIVDSSSSARWSPVARPSARKSLAPLSDRPQGHASHSTTPRWPAARSSTRRSPLPFRLHEGRRQSPVCAKDTITTVVSPPEARNTFDTPRSPAAVPSTRRSPAAVSPARRSPAARPYAQESPAPRSFAPRGLQHLRQHQGRQEHFRLHAGRRQQVVGAKVASSTSRCTKVPAPRSTRPQGHAAVRLHQGCQQHVRPDKKRR